MLIPEVHGVGARVLVDPSDGRPPYEAIVQGHVVDGRVPRLDRDKDWYWFASSKDRTDGAEAWQVQRILQVNMPSGDTFEAIRTATVREGANDDPDAPITMYIVRYLHAPTVHEYAYPYWVTPL